jgi:hypothetical protein
MSAPQARVLVVSGAYAGWAVGVMAKEAVQHMTGMSDSAVLEQERLAATSTPRAAIRGDRSVVDRVTEDGA